MEPRLTDAKDLNKGRNVFRVELKNTRSPVDWRILLVTIILIRGEF